MTHFNAKLKLLKSKLSKANSRWESAVCSTTPFLESEERIKCQMMEDRISKKRHQSTNENSSLNLIKSPPIWGAGITIQDCKQVRGCQDGRRWWHDMIMAGFLSRLANVNHFFFNIYIYTFLQEQVGSISTIPTKSHPKQYREVYCKTAHVQLCITMKKFVLFLYLFVCLSSLIDTSSSPIPQTQTLGREEEKTTNMKWPTLCKHLCGHFCQQKLVKFPATKLFRNLKMKSDTATNPLFCTFPGAGYTSQGKQIGYTSYLREGNT